jgi:hypothetical protein
LDAFSATGRQHVEGQLIQVVFAEVVFDRLFFIFLFPGRHGGVNLDVDLHKEILFFGPFNLANSFVYDLELVGPVGGVDPGTHVESVVVAAFGVIVEGRRKGGGFVAVVGIVDEEFFNFLGEVLYLGVHIFVDHAVEHRDWTKSLYFSKSTEYAQLVIGQTHVFLISLGDFAFFQWTEFGAWGGFENIIQDTKIMYLVEVGYYLSESEFRERSDGVEIG